MQPKIYIIHENDEWTAPLINHLEQLGCPYESWFISEGNLNLTEDPPAGVFYNRMSASSHTRGHRYSPEYTASVLGWLESHHRTVLNKSRALQLEISKVLQYTSLQAHGIQSPKTIACIGKDHILNAAKSMNGPFITKHNRAGKGLGVQLFQTTEALQNYVNSDDFEDSIDGITLIQEYIQSTDSTITRCEFIDGKFLYAVQVDTSEGFELCPADVCQIGDSYCPTTEPKAKFTILKDFNDPIIGKYERFLINNDIHFAGIEFIKDKDGIIYTYDVNTNTNYNAEAEQRAGIFGMKAIAETLKGKLSSL
ncbi:alpha-L-glutamate ligase [Bacillus timonensis]|nr:alpha-L-glutamate ligase [Bacillus timonensis]